MEDLTTTTKLERGEPTLTIAQKEAFLALVLKASRATNRGESPAQITTTITDTKTHGQTPPQTSLATVPTKKSIKLALHPKTRKVANSIEPMAATLNMPKTNNSREVSPFSPHTASLV